MRRQYPELEQSIIIPMRKMIPAQVAAYNGTMRMFNFVNGSSIKFGHYDSDSSIEYQGRLLPLQPAMAVE